MKGTQRIAEIGGLTESHAWLGWSLVIGVVAIAGLPPFGIFMSEFLVVSSSFGRSPLLALLLVFGLLIALGVLILRLNSIAFDTPHGPSARVKASYGPLITHFALVLAIGLYLPGPLVTWFQQVALAGLRKALWHRFTASPACLRGVGAVIPVDLHIAGCPPRPTEILSALVVLLVEVPDRP